MAYYTPKNHPWRATQGYEMIDAFPVPIHPATIQRVAPCYQPRGMSTSPLSFPSLAVGFDRNPIHAARAALGTRYAAEKWIENQKSLMGEVTKNLEASRQFSEKLELLTKKEKEKLKSAADADAKAVKNFEETVNHLQSKVNELSSELKKVIEENKKMQDCKRKLQACIGNIEGPLQIAEECLCLRESRKRNDLVNDKVEQRLMKEIETYRESQKSLEKYLEQCDNQLISGRKTQNELENFIKNIQWIICVERSPKAVERFSKSNWENDMHCHLKNSSQTLTNLSHKLKQIEAYLKEVTQGISKKWDETNKAFEERRDQMKQAKDEIFNSLVKIKNEIFNVEKNLKCLKSNKELNDELQQGQDQLESLLRTKKNLESELLSKLNSLFIDEQKCITMRKCYPISIVTNF